MTAHSGGVVTKTTVERTGPDSDEQLSARVRFFRHPVTAVTTTVASMFAMVLLGGLLFALMYSVFTRITGHAAEGTWRTVLTGASYVCIAGFAVLLVLVWRRLAGLHMRGLGLTPWLRLWLLIPGFAIAMAVNYAASGVAVAAGTATWNSEQPELLSTAALLAVVIIFFGQAVPEELLWRGHLAGVLRLRMGTSGIILTTSLGFGTLHILSRSNAENFGDQLAYVAQAVALGYLLIAVRLGASSVWLAVGFHTGYNLFFDLVTPLPGSYGFELLTRAVILAILATITLRSCPNSRQRPPAYVG